MTPTQLHILRHSLGLDAHGHGRPYRNHYVAGGDDVAVCDGLVEIECMSRRVGSELSGGDPIYHVTEKGRAAAAPTTRPMKTTQPKHPRRWVKLFQSQFVPKLRSGAKSTTIRPLPKRAQDWPQKGDIIDARHWFAKPYRSPQMAILTARIICVRPVEIHTDGIVFKKPNGEVEVISVGNMKGSRMLEQIAALDGFNCWHDMGLWFQSTHGLPFTGILIEWDTTTISRGTARAEGFGSSPTPDLATGVGEAKSPAGNDALVAELRAEIARLTRENAELEAEVTAITREPAEVRCQELAAMLGESGQRNHRLIDRRAELMGAGRELDEELRKLGYLETPSQVAWRRMLRKKPSDYQPKQPHTPSH